MNSDRYFRIIGNNGRKLTLRQAANLTDMFFYDPLGIDTIESPYYAESLLTALKQWNMIKDFEVLSRDDWPKLPPREDGVVYDRREKEHDDETDMA